MQIQKGGVEKTDEVSTVNYHVVKLLAHDLIEKVGERPVRGAVENIYRAKVLPVITDEEFEEFTKTERIVYVETLLGLYASEASSVLETETLLGNYWHIA